MKSSIILLERDGNVMTTLTQNTGVGILHENNDLRVS